MVVFMNSNLPRLLLAEDPTPSPFPPPHTPSSPLLRPNIIIIVGILTTVFSLTFLLLLYAKHCNRSVTTYASSSNTTLTAIEKRHSGVNRSVVDSLPVFRFGSLTGHKDGLDCAVCLARFELNDILRLLPKCKHGFHVECVDTWLEAHSTCPLCRVRVDPEDVFLVFDPNQCHQAHHQQQQQQRQSGEGMSLPAFVRRISGRHSSAGEKRSNLGQTAARRMSEGGGASIGCFDRVRKDGMLSTESMTENSEFERRFSHRINVVSSGIINGAEGSFERWSDLKPSDLLYLRSEMIITNSGRISNGKIVNSLRSVSEITGVSRFREGEERTLNKWLGFKAKRPVTELTLSSVK